MVTTDVESIATMATDRRAAFAALTDRYLDAAYRLAGVILGDPVEAEDATHDAVVAAWRAYGSLRDPDRFEAWFQRILINTCRDRLRRRSRRPVVAIDLVGRTVATGDAISSADDRVVLDRAFSALGPDHRIVIALRYFTDLSIEEIAVRVGIPAGTVKSRLHVATRNLQAALDGESEGRP
jgi:RNA polymerase sigma-70 factor (ECF subfamily)